MLRLFCRLYRILLSKKSEKSHLGCSVMSTEMNFHSIPENFSVACLVVFHFNLKKKGINSVAYSPQFHMIVCYFCKLCLCNNFKENFSVSN